MERICSKCGSPIDDGDVFCDICGAKYEEPEGAEKTADTQNVKKAEAKPAAQKSAKQSGSDFFAKNKERVIFAAVALAVIVAAIIIACVMTSNTPEATLKKAIEYRLAGNVDGSAGIDYESNFSKVESKSEILARMKGNAELTVKHSDPIKIKLKTEKRLINDTGAGVEDLDTKKNALSAMYNDTHKITDIRELTYELVDGDTVKSAGSAQAIKVNGKWYILGVAQAALTF